MVSEDKKRVYAKIDFYERGNRVIETLNIQQLRDFGYKIDVVSYGLLMSKGNKSYPVTSYPLDNRQFSKREERRLRQPEPRQQQDQALPFVVAGADYEQFED